MKNQIKRTKLLMALPLLCFQFLILSLALVLVLVFVPSGGAASVCAPTVGNCEYYNCRHEQLHCSAEDYFAQFGYSYCQRFEQIRGHFSRQGLIVINEIRTCLQQRMEDQADLTCQNALHYAYGHHEYCYIQAGFCGLGIHDKWVVLREVYPELERRGFRAALVKVGSACLSQF